ncbi:MAG: transposase [Thermodesulfovibrionales bacterium]
MLKNQDLPLLPDSIISVDRAYIDYKWLYSLRKPRVTFVTRAKKNLKYEIIGQHEVDEKRGLLFDQTIKLTGYYQSRYYPEELSLVGFIDPETKKELVFLTNNFTLSAYTITQIYKSRWQIELFFKWIKQKNAVVLE